MRLILGLPSIWEGPEQPDDLVVRPLSFQDAPGRAITLRVALGVETGFRKHLSGYWTRVVGLAEVFACFSTTGISEILVNWPDQNRELFWSPAIQAHLTTEGMLQRLILPEDGHNEDVRRRIGYCGFVCSECLPWLIAGRSPA